MNYEIFEVPDPQGIEAVDGSIAELGAEIGPDELHLPLPELRERYPNAASKEFVRATLYERNLKNGGARVLAEGDSWFDFPLPLFNPRGTDVIDCLALYHGFAITEHTRRGDLIREMVMGSNVKKLYQEMLLIKPKAFILSGGGNDMVGPKNLVEGESYLEYIANPYGDPNLVNAARLAEFIREMKRVFKIFIEASMKAKTPIVLHNYANAFVTGIGAGPWKFNFSGPWMSKALCDSSHRYPLDSPEANEIVRTVIAAITDLLISFADDDRYKGFIRVVDSRRIINSREYWRDELHLIPDGWYRVANFFSHAINYSKSNSVVFK